MIFCKKSPRTSAHGRYNHHPCVKNFGLISLKDLLVDEGIPWQQALLEIVDDSKKKLRLRCCDEVWHRGIEDEISFAE